VSELHADIHHAVLESDYQIQVLDFTTGDLRLLSKGQTNCQTPRIAQDWISYYCRGNSLVRSSATPSNATAVNLRTNQRLTIGPPTYSEFYVVMADTDGKTLLVQGTRAHPDVFDHTGRVDLYVAKIPRIGSSDP
jgi:hypothetical protein